MFSPDGRFLLLNTREGFLGLMDSFSGAITSTYAGVSNDKGVALDACFSPDGGLVYAGSGTRVLGARCSRLHNYPLTMVYCKNHSFFFNMATPDRSAIFLICFVSARKL